jgi:hypothetical protein
MKIKWKSSLADRPRCSLSQGGLCGTISEPATSHEAKVFFVASLVVFATFSQRRFPLNFHY